MISSGAFAGFVDRIHDLGDVARHLALAIDDAPDDGAEPAVIESLRAAAAGLGHEVEQPFYRNDLPEGQHRVNRIARTLRQEIGAYDILREIERIAAERGGAWPRWKNVIGQALDRCENSTALAADALVVCWREIVP